MKEEKEKAPKRVNSKEEPNILDQLKEAKKDFIETLKIPKKELLLPTVVQSIKEKRSFKAKEYINLPMNSITLNNSMNIRSIKQY